jgi:hypothetical protein
VVRVTVLRLHLGIRSIWYLRCESNGRSHLTRTTQWRRVSLSYLLLLLLLLLLPLLRLWSLYLSPLRWLDRRGASHPGCETGDFLRFLLWFGGIGDDDYRVHDCCQGFPISDPVLIFLSSVECGRLGCRRRSCDHSVSRRGWYVSCSYPPATHLRFSWGLSSRRGIDDLTSSRLSKLLSHESVKRFVRLLVLLSVTHDWLPDSRPVIVFLLSAELRHLGERNPKRVCNLWGRWRGRQSDRVMLGPGVWCLPRIA